MDMISDEVSWSPHPQPSIPTARCLHAYAEHPVKLLPPGGGFSISEVAERHRYM